MPNFYKCSLNEKAIAPTYFVSAYKLSNVNLCSEFNTSNMLT